MIRGRTNRATIARRRERIEAVVRALPGAEIEGDQHLGFSVRDAHAMVAPKRRAARGR